MKTPIKGAKHAKGDDAELSALRLLRGQALQEAIAGDEEPEFMPGDKKDESKRYPDSSRAVTKFVSSAQSRKKSTISR